MGTLRPGEIIHKADLMNIQQVVELLNLYPNALGP